MAAVTSDVLDNMLRSSLNGLKSFVEILNAELTEEGQGEESRITHKEDVSRVLNEFGECEAYLGKSIKCLKEVEAKINNHFDESGEMIDQKTLKEEISNILGIIAGKDKDAGKDKQAVDDDRTSNLDMDENRINQQFAAIKDVLDEFHPFKLTEYGEDEDQIEEEEERISQRLEKMQKKAMSNLEKRMSSVGTEDDEEYAAQMDRNVELSDSSGDEAIDYEGLEKYKNKSGCSNAEAKKDMDAKLKQMWNNYKQELTNVQSLDAKQLFSEAMDGQGDVDFKTLKYYSMFNESTLELFSREAVVVLDSNTNYVDPISKKDITQPVRNKICNHIYEKDTIYGILKNKKEMRCPLLGCSSRFSINDLVEDDEIAAKISQSQARKKASIQQDTEDMETEDEDEDDADDTTNVVNDSMNADTENDDTQSQELF